MLTAADNERLTRVGPGTPMGETLRRYWLPALLSEELPENDGAPVRVRLLAEDFVAFRDSDGQVGLVSAFCPHRRAPMFFGRNEERGLRCVYHGWKFDRRGTCIDMPSEPPDSLFKTKVGIEAYPAWEGGGIVWAYLGPQATMPPPPDYELVRVPATHRFMSKTFEDCNYLQALEGGLDSTHATILHHATGDTSFLRDYEGTIPRIDVYVTDYGYMYTGVRASGDRQWVRAYQYIMPSLQMRGTIQPVYLPPGVGPRMDGHIWVPIDDTHTWVYNFMYSYYPDAPLPYEHAMAGEKFQGRGEGDITPDFRPVRNRSNDYHIDRRLQKTGSFTGIEGIATQDFATQESMGPVVDRAKEHLGTTDRPIIVMRQLLLEATQEVAAGRMPRGSNPDVCRAVRALDHLIPQDDDWQATLKEELKALY